MLLIQAGLSLALLRSSTLTSRVPDALVTVGLFAATTSASVIAVAALSLVKHLAWRAAALQSLGALASLRRGCAILRQHLRHAALMQLAMIGVDLVWPIVISPVALVSLALGTILGALCTLLAGSVSGLFVQSVWRWVLAGGLVGVPVLFLTLITPMAALVALRVVFQSCT